MAGFIGNALSALFNENDQLVWNARRLGGVAACRIHRVEEATDLMTGERVVRWQIEFATKEDSETFDNAVRAIVGAVTEEGE